MAAVTAVFRRSALSNDRDRESLLANPDVLHMSVGTVASGRTRLAVAGSEVVGFARTIEQGDLLELEDLFVDPHWTRRGIGRDLVLDATKSTREAGCQVIEVTGNRHALVLYESVGFTPIGSVGTPLGTVAARLRLRVGQ